MILVVNLNVFSWSKKAYHDLVMKNTFQKTAGTFLSLLKQNEQNLAFLLELSHSALHCFHLGGYSRSSNHFAFKASWICELDVQYRLLKINSRLKLNRLSPINDQSLWCEPPKETTQSGYAFVKFYCWNYDCPLYCWYGRTIIRSIQTFFTLFANG